MKTQHLPKGFLSTNGNPTINSIIMYFVYLWNLPKDWNEQILNYEAVEKVRDHFGVSHGFGTMIRWGIQHSCCKSKTSSCRHSSMSQAYILSKSLIGSGVELGNVPMLFPMLKVS